MDDTLPITHIRFWTYGELMTSCRCFVFNVETMEICRHGVDMFFHFYFEPIDNMATLRRYLPFDCETMAMNWWRFSYVRRFKISRILVMGLPTSKCLCRDDIDSKSVFHHTSYANLCRRMPTLTRRSNVLGSCEAPTKYKIHSLWLCTLCFVASKVNKRNIVD